MQPLIRPNGTLIQRQAKCQIGNSCDQGVAVDQRKTDCKAKRDIEEELAQCGSGFAGLGAPSLDKSPMQKEDDGCNHQNASRARQLLAQIASGIDRVQPALVAEPDICQCAQNPVQPKDGGDIADQRDQIEVNAAHGCPAIHWFISALNHRGEDAAPNCKHHNKPKDSSDH